MDIEKVGKICATKVAVGASLLATTTILLCYTLAVSLGHVPAWLPMISDCAVYPPEKYPFRIGMIISSCLIYLSALFFYFYIGFKSTTKSAWDKPAIVLAGIASTGLAVVGAVNEDEDMRVHSTAAVIFFFCYEAFMCITTHRCAGLSINPRSLAIKRFISVVTAFLLAGFVYFSQHWGKYHIQIALCEWFGVLFILLYNLSMCYEFQDEYAAEMLIAPSSSSLPTRSPVPTPTPHAVLPYPMPPMAPVYHSGAMYYPMPMMMGNSNENGL